VQAKTDSEGGEVTPRELWSIFKDEYLPAKDGETNDWGRFTPVAHTLVSGEEGTDRITATMLDRGVEVTVEGTGNGPIAAFIDALGTLDIDVRVLDYHEHALSAGGDARAAAYVECAVGDRVLWGVGLHSSIVKASLTAILSAVNRAERDAG
jgi:2-isopropylmalate synthase